jgi:hypothetical protein
MIMKKLLSVAIASLVLVSAQSFAEPRRAPGGPGGPGGYQGRVPGGPGPNPEWRARHREPGADGDWRRGGGDPRGDRGDPDWRARYRDPGVNRRQAIQDGRIEQGVRSGELTRQEMGDLYRERRDIRQEERAYKSDGVLTKDERKDLHQDLNDLSKDIYTEKHDDEKRTRAAAQ